MGWSRSAAYSKAWLAAAAIGAAAMTLLFAVSTPFGWGSLYLAFFDIAFMCFFLGILILGFPAWAVAHRLGRNKWYDAMLLGGVLSFGVMFAWAMAFEMGLKNAALLAAQTGIAGFVAGFTGWRIISTRVH